MKSTNARTKYILALTIMAGLLTALTVLVVGDRQARRQETDATSSQAQATPTQAGDAYGRIPLSFEANRGQTDPSVNFLARGAGYTLFLKPSEAVIAMRGREAEPATGEGERVAGGRGSRAESEANAPERMSVLRMKLEGADAGAQGSAEGELAGRVNYFVGNDPSEWRADVPVYGRVRYREVYAGVDVVYYGNQRRLEYDFVVAPGADPRSVRLRFEGADAVEVDEGGDLLLTLGRGVVRQSKPLVYQESAGVRREVEGGYTLDDGVVVGFDVGEYDPSLPLVIDPVLVYSTYLGGGAIDDAHSVAVDSSGNAYVCGFTTSTNFPTASPIQAANGAFRDAFITKLNAAGSAIVYSTYLGGSGTERCFGITVDASGNVYAAGETGSTNFPTANALQATKGTTNEDAFVAKLNPAGSALVFSTYLGGSESTDLARDIALDSSNNVYVSGLAFSDDFPTVNPIQAAHGGGVTDAFLTKINAAGTAIVYSTYLGGNGNDDARGVAVDSSGNAYLAGLTGSTNFPTASPIQAANAGGDSDAFAAKVNAAGSALVYSTYLGGSDLETGEDVVLDASGNAHIVGQTISTNFPVANAIQPANGGGVLQDAFVAKLNAAGSAFVYSTYLGGLGGEIGFGIALDSSGNTHVVGATSSTNTFPTADAIKCERTGTTDAFVTKLNAAGSAFVYSTYLGGSGTEQAREIAVDSSASAYVVGITGSTDFPTVGPAQAASGGSDDAFALKLGTASGPTCSATPTPTPTVQFDSATFNVTEGCVPALLTVTLSSTPSGTVTVDYTVAEGTAKQKTDFTFVAGTLFPQAPGATATLAGDHLASGTLTFAAGETAKEITVLITEDGFAEGTENLTATLSNPNGATLGTNATTTLNINDNETVNSSTNPIDDAATYVCQLYHDFLHRQGDAPGQAFWTNEITTCGADAACVAERRHNVAAAFFLSIEFQRTGYFVYRAYEAGLNRRPAYEEFMRDLNTVGLGIEVGVGDWEQRLAAQRQAFLEALVQRSEFTAQFPGTMTADEFATKLFANADVTPTDAERQAVVAAYGSGNTQGRAAALASGLESASVFNRLYNPGFVLIEYFGFMRRDPEDPPDSDLSGYNFWLAKMDAHSLAGEDMRSEGQAFARIRRAEMIRAFIIAEEYRARFGQP